MNQSIRLRRRRVGVLAVFAVALGVLGTAAAAPTPASAVPSDYMIYPASGNIQSRVGDGCRGNYRDHDGIDISHNGGTPILAAADGTISYKGTSGPGGYGNYVDVTHAGGYVTRYAHMASASPLAVGTLVSQGTQIGVVGNSGTSAMHLHFEVYRNGDLYTAINENFKCLSDVTRGATMPTPFPGLAGSGPSSVKFDINGDVKADMLAVRSDGYLVVYFGNGAGGTMLTQVGGPGWATTTSIVTGDFNGDNAGDFMQTRSDGGLYFYKGNFTSNFTPTYLGPGWNTYSLITGGVDFNGDGRRDLVARASNSNLYLYPGDGGGSFGTPVQIGTNWSAFNALIAGDFDKNGRGDLIARNAAGELWAYYGTANGFAPAQQVGQGWGGFTSIFSNGDHSGDGNPDIMGRRGSDQTLWLFPGNGTGSFGNGYQVGSGWGAYPIIS